MTTNPYQDIAREFMDLWQKQMTSVMGDKQFIHAMLELFQNMQAKPNDKTNATAADTSHASTAEHGLLAELAFRLAMCEKRISALEGKQPATGKTTKRRMAKSNTGRSKKPNK